jgi:GntR family transcriptional regulator
VKIDSNSPTYAYHWLAAILRQQIQRGKIASQLPSLTTLVEQAGVAVVTVRRAIDVLVQEQLVETVPGRGTFAIR